MKKITLLLATGFGAGYSPVAPGTAGTLLAIPLYLLLSRIRFPLYELTLLTFFFLSVFVSGKAQDYFERKDDPKIVIDEIMGFFITMLWVPKTLILITAGFFLFRFFDIVKPPPIRLAEKIRGGYGVVLDDVIAGIYANLVLYFISFCFPLS